MILSALKSFSDSDKEDLLVFSKAKKLKSEVAKCGFTVMQLDTTPLRLKASQKLLKKLSNSIGDSGGGVSPNGRKIDSIRDVLKAVICSHDKEFAAELGIPSPKEFIDIEDQKGIRSPSAITGEELSSYLTSLSTA